MKILLAKLLVVIILRGGGSNGKNASFSVQTVECDSIDSGIDLINTYSDKTIDLSHCKLLLLSEELAKKGVSPIIYTLMNKVEIRPDCNIIVSKIPANEFKEKQEPSMQDILPIFYDVTTNTKNQSGYTENIPLSDFYSNLKCSSCEPVAALGIICNQKKEATNTTDNAIGLDKASTNITSADNRPIVEILGLSVFKNDKLVGTLSGIETVCYLLLTDKIDNSSISVPSPFSNKETLDLLISLNNKPKIRVYTSAVSPYTLFDINLNAKILSFNNSTSTITSDIIKQVENSTNNYLTEQFYNILYKTSRKYNSDIVGIGRYVKKNFYTLYDWEDYNWLSNYESTTFNVNVNFSIKSGYLLTNE